MHSHNHTILILCPDQQGLIFQISAILSKANLNIEKNDEFVDKEQNMFFMRTEVSGELDKELLGQQLSDALPHESQIKIIPQSKKSLLIFCTKENHCLGDLLLRYESGELDVEIKAVISNYPHLGDLVGKFGIEFLHISHQNLTRQEHEARILQACSKYEVDYLVLAKYMRILSPHFVKQYEQKIINIHHSFLPAFIGANPYKQAYERGVKLIGATAHFVNDNLDEGPIIAQDVININHTYSWRDMQKAGRNIEKIVFAKAIELALQDRIFVYGNKTVVF
ncbi:formyltetrahydrofolate deformylase [Helicobacter mustelae]|uniref:formyltetrahydrofolate deformylase n=1 Tax=Helicobacter mustelae TaxID=217 RepID=UPI000E04DCBF|nr:formyltetrahydrofolate deformylase [Helicobacter mustelae]STP12453.1 formyltetrahydrofolate deformylase [Helicobacter mustelae]